MKVPAKCEFGVVWIMTSCSLLSSYQCFGSIRYSSEHELQFVIDPAFYFKRLESA